MHDNYFTPEAQIQSFVLTSQEENFRGINAENSSHEICRLINANARCLTMSRSV